MRRSSAQVQTGVRRENKEWKERNLESTKIREKFYLTKKWMVRGTKL